VEPTEEAGTEAGTKAGGTGTGGRWYRLKYNLTYISPTFRSLDSVLFAHRFTTFST
jgi:hypothetical protein